MTMKDFIEQEKRRLQEALHWFNNRGSRMTVRESGDLFLDTLVDSFTVTRIAPHFDAAAIKLLWLAIRTIEDKRARERAKEAGLPKGSPRKAPGKLVEGSLIQGWKAALGELALVYPDRINTYL